MDSTEFGIGLNEVYEPEPGNAPVAIICLVHGLFGGPWKTFAAKRRPPRDEKGASKEVFWPRDLLPTIVRNVRIISFGFDADVEKFMGAASLNTIHQHSRNLLNTMCDQLDSQLPIIFVAHSLGGVIVKDALNQSAGATTDQTRQRLLKNTHGIIFLGTPHRGSSSATYGRTAFRLSQFVAFQSANIKLITALERNSETLDRISTEFNESLAKNKNINMWSYSEERQVSRDDGFVKVSSVLKQWVKDLSRVAVETVLLAPGYKECLSSLDDPIARHRIHGVEHVSQSNRGSLEWLYTDTVPFVDWLRDDYSRYDPLFWVTGKPGSGKSTLMRFALSDYRTMEAIPRSEGAPIAYFFHLRGSSLVQKSLKGMLQELLHQILAQFPTFYDLVSQIYDRVRRTADASGWDIASLSECLLKIPDLTIGPDSRARVMIFVDALDENENQHENEQLMKLILDLSDTYCSRMKNFDKDEASPRHELPILKICLASRPWPLFKRLLGNKSRIPSFAIHHYTKDDIRAYARLLLVQPLRDSQPSDPYYHGVLELANDITKKAQGVFVWVRVVVDSSRRQIIDGTPIEVLKQQIMGYPDELKNLYELTVQRIPNDYHEEAEIMFKTILGSATPLSLAQLYVVAQSCLGRPPDSDWKVSSQTAAWLASRTGGLVEEILSSSRDTETMFVQFIHQTVQEYIKDGAKGLELSPIFGSLEARICGIHLLILACGMNVNPNYNLASLAVSDRKQREGDEYKANDSHYTHHSLLRPILRNLFTYLRACEAYMDVNPDHRQILIDMLDSPLISISTSINGRGANLDFITKGANLDFITTHLEGADRAKLSDLLLELRGRDKPLEEEEDKDYKEFISSSVPKMVRLPGFSGISQQLRHAPKRKADRKPVSRFKRAVYVILQLNAIRPVDFAWLLMITQNIYHFNLARGYNERTDICQIIAAIGPRLVSERTNRPRMLRRLIENHEISYATLPRRYHATWFRSVPKTLVVDPEEGISWSPVMTVIHLLATAKPKKNAVDDKQLREMTDIILSSLSYSQKSDMSEQYIFVRDHAEQGHSVNLVIFCARYKSNGSEWVSLLREHGVTASPLRVDMFDQIALNIAMDGGCRPRRRIEDMATAALYPSLFLLAPGMGGNSILDCLKIMYQPLD
ncbi:alpha/beta-Hydrolase [Apiospora arundinis]